ncbi:MAG: hypothetical protein ISR85_00145 [Kiritimatiellales bacterium]|nr:hypothetical protein [Kiritimatiellota bacterium]MBL7011322.1 hypothetical protein [Kiritimatiellales bacterium]
MKVNSAQNSGALKRSVRKIRLYLALPLLSALLCDFALAEEGQWKFSTGVDYSSGDYTDASDTTMLYVPFSASYKRGNWSGKISTGWLSIDGPGNVIDGGVVLPGGGTDRSESGIADTWLALTYSLEALPSELGYLDLTGKVKIPTADEDKGLGTGEVDYALQADYFYVMGKLTPMFTVGYKFKGDPADMNLNDVLYLSAGADWRCSDNTHIGASLDFQQASVSGVDDPLEVFTYLNHKISEAWSLSPYFYYGLSDSSPDMGGGLQLIFKP